MFKGPVGFGRFVNLVMNILLCAALSFYVLWYNQQLMPDVPILTPLSFAVSFAQSMFVGLCFGAVVPGFAWGQALAAALGIKSETVAYVVACCVHAFIMVSMISFICGWLANVMTLGIEGVVAGWLACWPVVVGMGAVILILFMRPAMSFAAKVSGFDPTAAPAE